MTQEKKVNTYIVEKDNNINLLVHSTKSIYCMKCGSVLDKDSLDRFCDSYCRSEYYAEIRNDIYGIIKD